MKMKTIILITLLILTIYIGSVSAANDTAIDHTLMGNDESNQVEISNTEDSKEISVINKNSKDIENNILTNTVHQFNGTTFSELKTKINSISSGDTIVLNNNIEQDISSFITINKDIIIEGNNHTIDGKNNSLFYFSDQSKNVEINNINFINYRDCIEACGNNITIYGCVFNNTLNSSAHAVYLYSSKPSNFSIINCNFLANPRALYISGDYLFLSYCNFTKNSLAIDCNAHIFGEINNCIFMNNNNLKSQMIAFNYGGFRNSTYNISNCVFMNNTGVDDKFIYFGASNSNISNCIFVNNNEIGSNNGGLLLMTGSNCTLYNCSFINNTSNEGAGLCISGSNSTIDNCTFINNTVATYMAGAIHWYCHDGSIINSKFLNNPGNDGSSIFLSYPCRLINNTNNNFVIVFNGATKYIPCTVTIMDNSTINATIFKPITLKMLIQPNDPVYHLKGYFDLNFVIEGNTIQVYTESISYVFNKDGNFTISFNSTYLTNVTVNTALVHVISGDFGYLRQLINQANEGDVINLTRDYVFTDGLDQVIPIRKSITINGNGHIIDARGKSNIFELTTPCEVVFNNITFLNSKDKTINMGSNSRVNMSILNCKFINSTGTYDIYGSTTNGNLYLHNNTMKKVIYYTDTILSKVYVSVQDNSTSFVQFNKSVNIKINLWDDNNNTLNPSFNCVRLLLDNGTSFRPTMGINTLYVSCTFKECRNFTLSVTSEYLKNMTIFTGCVDVRIGDYYYLQRLINNASDGDVINLTRDYNRFPEIDDYSVIINKENLTINGNGHVIDAGGKAQIFRCNAKGVTLKNITFTNSSSWAVYLNGANQTIDHCNFVNMNSYSNVVQVSGVNNIISNCYFSNTHSTNYNDIFLNSGSSCYLKNNTGSKIYSNGGDILSKTNIIILDNSTVYNNNQNKTRITAIITDDNNNKIGGNYLVNYFVLDNGTKITTTLDRDEMFYYAEYLFADYEDYIISSQNRRENLVNVSIFNATVCIREYANISVSTSPIIYGENASFIINITDSDIALGEILLSIGQHNYIINLNDTYTGLITYNVAGLTPDDYEVKVNYTSPYLYGEVVANTTLHVSKAEFELNVNVVEGNGSIPTIFNVTCPEDFDGNISIEINGQTEYIPITKGKGSVEIILPYGYYTGLIKAFNSALYNNTNTTCNVHIRDNPNLSVSADTIIYPENATIIIKLLDVVRGSIILSIGEYNTTIELNDSFTGIINFNMPNLTPDTYDIQVNYTGSEYFTESIVKSTLTVYKAEFELNVNITIGDSNIPTKFNVTCPADFDGYVIVEVNDNSYLVSLTHGKGSVDIIIPKGDYISVIKTINSKLYNDTNITRNLHIVDNPNLNVDCEPIKYGENATITIKLENDVRGYIILNVGEYNTTIILNDSFTGVINHIVPNLTPDTYEVKVNYTGSEVYLPAVSIKTLTVNKAEFNLDADVVKGNGTIPTKFNIIAPEDFDGNISITINNNTYLITNNSITIDLDCGNYIGLIKAYNSTLYEPVNKTINVNIKDNPNLSVECNPITYGENGNIIIKLLENVRGTVLISIGKYNATIDITDDFNGTIIHSIRDLTPGIYNVKINFTGSDYYIQSTANTTLTVSKARFNINVSVVEGNGSIPTKFNVITPKDFDGYVSIIFNSNNYLIPIIDGNGSINLTISHGNYPIVIKAENSRLYNNTNISFNVHIIDTPRITVYCDSITYGENATVIIMLPNDIRGSVTLTVHNYTSVVDLNESFTGTITRIIPNLTPNTYIVKVNYTGDEYYKSNVIYSTLKVNKAPVNIITDIDKGNNTVLTKIAVNLPGDFNGNVNVKINDETYNIPIINNTGSINVNLTSGNYTLEFIAFNSLNYMDTKLNENLHIVTPLSEDVFEIPLNISEGIVNFEVNGLPGDANGYFMVVINGLTAQSVDVVNGNVTPININLTSGEYNITMIFADKGEYGVVFKSTNITVGSKDPVITIIDNKDVSVSYSGKATYSVHILSGGVDVVDGENVTIVFNGINNVVKTLNGYASLALNTAVAVGKYTIVAEYKNKTVSNSVSILNIINTNNLKTLKKSKKVNKVKISLAQVDGMYLRGKTIVLKIKGKKVASAKTNSKGVATLKIKKKSLKKFKRGKYVANVSYGLDRVDKTIKIK